MIICSNNFRTFNSLIACFVVLDAVSLSLDLLPLLLEYLRSVAEHFSNFPKTAANLFPKKVNIFLLSLVKKYAH